MIAYSALVYHPEIVADDGVDAVIAHELFDTLDEAKGLISLLHAEAQDLDDEDDTELAFSEAPNGTLSFEGDDGTLYTITPIDL